MPPEFDVSIVLPCLNEAETVGTCVKKAYAPIDRLGLRGEVIVCDNGSRDGSAQIAERSGARVVREDEPGYGIAIQRGIEASTGRYIIIADADDTYDLSQTDAFMEQLQAGYQYVMGSRFKGKIHDGAMPWLHRYLGNPVLTLLLRLLFGSRFSDAQCGMRAFTRKAYEAMGLSAAGMEFASEMVIRAAQLQLKSCEVAVDYYPRQVESKLRPWRDGWRHLRFIMMFFPLNIYWGPGLLATVVGLFFLLGPLASFLTGQTPEGTLYRQLVGSLLTIVGFQLGTVGLFAKTYALIQGFEQHNPFIYGFYRHFNLEKGLLIGLLAMVLGLLAHWYPTLRHVLPQDGLGPDLNVSLVGLTFAIIGSQVLVSSFFLSLMSIKVVERIRRGRPAQD